MLVQLIPFIGFMLTVAIVSWRLTRKEKLYSKDGYFLGGRSLTGLFIAGSLLLTNLSTEHLVGLNGSAYTYGMEVMAWETLAALAMVAMAVYFLPKYLKMGLTTITQFLELRFDKQTRIVISGLFLLLYTTTLLPIVLYTGAINLESIFNVSKILGTTTFNATVLMIFLIGLTGSLYAIFGGLKAVAVSDTINGIGLIIGGLAIPIIAFYQIGDADIFAGINKVYNTVPEHFNAIGDKDSDLPFAVIFTGLFIPQIFYWTMNQSIIQRTLGAKNLAEGQKGVLIAAFVKIVIPVIVVIPGIIAYYYFKGGLENQDLAYPELIKAVLPSSLTGIFAAIIVGAVLSTFNSALNSASTLFSIDIYKEYINKEASETKIVKVGKISAGALAVVIIAIAPLISQMKKGLYYVLQELSSIFNMPILAVILAGLLIKSVSAKGVKIGLVSGVALYLLSKFGLEALGVDYHFLHRLAFAFLITIGTMIIASKKYPRKNNFIIKNQGYVNVENWKYLKPVSIAVVICTILVYILLSPIGILSEK
ncbi:MAG: solute:sodium symporter family transporter [Tenacibaculum sp.]